MLTARVLDEVEPQLRALLGLVDGSEQTRRVLDFVIAYAASVGRGAVQLKEKQRAVQYPTGTASPLKRILAVIDGTGRTSRALDYVIGYAASVGPVEAVVLDVHPEPIIAPNFPLGIIQTPSTGRTHQASRQDRVAPAESPGHRSHDPCRNRRPCIDHHKVRERRGVRHDRHQ